MDFSNISAKKSTERPIHPVEIFHQAKVLDAGINDLWLAQGDALREWHEKRDANDIGLVLNTGAGKTLVGLLISQSLVNETKSQVLYACSSIQLVEQTAEKAAGYGLDVCTYFGGEFSNDLYHQGKAPCITTYQALFNGRSRFFNEQCAAVVFDDAHAAEHLLRDHFTLRLKKSEFPGHYAQLIDLLRAYHLKIGKGTSYAELDNAESGALFFVPPFVVQSQLNEISRILLDANLAQPVSTKFSWAHLKDHIDLCCVLLTSTEIAITPPVVPVTNLPYFQGKTRRVYLSATLGSEDAFARTFGRAPDHVIAPETTAGECERMILMPSRLESAGGDVEATKAILAARKALVMVPTYSRAQKWAGFAAAPDRDRVTEAVNAFKAGKAPAKLLLAARYDGVDLPGDTCRVMVIDDLPMGVGPLERYLWERLELQNTLRTSIASRIVQSFGRISRGMSDHGVVVLTGDRLVQWLLIPRNAQLLPHFLQKQIKLGYEVSGSADTVEDMSSAIDQILARDQGWISAYDSYMKEAEAESADVDMETLVALAKNEAAFSQLMWDRDYVAAAKVLRGTLEDAFKVSASTGAWHALWLGYAYALANDLDSALELYQRAHSVQKNIPPIPRDGGEQAAADVPEQLVSVERLFTIRVDSALGLPKSLDGGLAHLDGSGTSGQTEESLRVLGELLGMTSTRPDKEHGTGPDVLWVIEGGPALCIEVKTDKAAYSRYQKKEVGQLGDHIQWVRDHTGIDSIYPIFVGPIRPATDTANPPPDFLVIGLDQFKGLAERVVAALRDIAANALPITLRDTVRETFQQRGLIWPDCFDSLESHCIRDIAES